MSNTPLLSTQWSYFHTTERIHVPIRPCYKRVPDGANENGMTSLSCGVSEILALDSANTYSIFKHPASCYSITILLIKCWYPGTRSDLLSLYTGPCPPSLIWRSPIPSAINCERPKTFCSKMNSEICTLHEIWMNESLLNQCKYILHPIWKEEGVPSLWIF